MTNHQHNINIAGGEALVTRKLFKLSIYWLLSWLAWLLFLEWTCIIMFGNWKPFLQLEAQRHHGCSYELFKKLVESTVSVLKKWDCGFATYSTCEDDISANHVAVVQCTKSCWYTSRASDNIQIKHHKKEKRDLSSRVSFEGLCKIEAMFKKTPLRLVWVSTEWCSVNKSGVSPLVIALSLYFSSFSQKVAFLFSLHVMWCDIALAKHLETTSCEHEKVFGDIWEFCRNSSVLVTWFLVCNFKLCIKEVNRNTACDFHRGTGRLEGFT